MKEIALEKCDAAVRELVRSVIQGEPVVLTEDSRPRFVLGATDEVEWEAFVLSRNAEFMKYLESARARGRAEGAKPLVEVRRRLVGS